MFVGRKTKARRIAASVALAMALATTVAAPPAQAAEVDAASRAAARKLGKEALGLYKNNDFEGALDRFSRAHELVNLTTTGLWKGRCLAKVGKLVEASELWLEVSRMALGADAKEVHKNAKAQAAKEREAIQPRIAQLYINLIGDMPDETKVYFDDKPLPRALIGVKHPINPGKHTLSVKGGGVSSATEIQAAEGATVTIPLRIVAPKPAPGKKDAKEPSPIGFGTATSVSADTGSTQRSLGWVALGFGIAGLGAGAVTGGLAASTKSDLDAGCPNAQCPPDLHADVDSFDTLRLASTISFVAGGVVTALGITLAASAPSAPSAPAETSWKLEATPGGVRWRGSF